jgi:AraC family transcriptional regulator
METVSVPIGHIRFMEAPRNDRSGPMASDRLEIVVKGQRQTALNTTPLLTGPAFVDTGLRMEEHEMRSFEMPDHWIPNYLVVFVRVPRPGKRFYVEGGREREFVVENGSSDVVGPQEMRNFRFEGEARSLILSIEPQVLQSMTTGSSSANAFELIRHWHGTDHILRDLLMRLRGEAQSGFPTGPLLAEHLSTELSAQLIQRYSIGKLRLDEYKGGLPGAKVKQVVDYVEAYLGLRLTMDEIARAAGLSKYHLGKAFSRSTGMTLHHFVLARRMGQSRELLVHSDLPLADIAAAVGFSSQSHFTTVFLERTGITPGRYRSKHRPLLMAMG